MKPTPARRTVARRNTPYRLLLLWSNAADQHPPPSMLAGMSRLHRLLARLSGASTLVDMISRLLCT